MYETMAVWETDSTLATQSEPMAKFANMWQASDKIVYSPSLPNVSSINTRIERALDPELIRQFKSSSARDLVVGGLNLAAQFLSEESTSFEPWSKHLSRTVFLHLKQRSCTVRRVLNSLMRS